MAQVQSLVGELRSHKPCSMAKKEKKKRERERKLKKKQKKTWYDMSAPAAIMKLGEGNIILRKRGARGRLK